MTDYNSKDQHSQDQSVTLSLLLKDSKERFRHTTKYLGSDDIVFSKGVYPYSYMTDRRRFDETELPPIDCFYDTLNDEPLDPKKLGTCSAYMEEFWHHKSPSTADHGNHCALYSKSMKFGLYIL